MLLELGQHHGFFLFKRLGIQSESVGNLPHQHQPGIQLLLIPLGDVELIDRLFEISHCIGIGAKT